MNKRKVCRGDRADFMASGLAGHLAGGRLGLGGSHLVVPGSSRFLGIQVESWFRNWNVALTSACHFSYSFVYIEDRSQGLTPARLIHSDISSFFLNVIVHKSSCHNPSFFLYFALSFRDHSHLSGQCSIYFRMNACFPDAESYRLALFLQNMLFSFNVCSADLVSLC